MHSSLSRQHDAMVAAADLIAPFRPPASVGVELPRHVPIYLPEVYPIPSAVEFNPSGSASTAGVQSDIGITLAPAISNDGLKLPSGTIGVIRGFSISITDMLASTNVSWTLRINGAPAGGYGAIKMFPRASSFVGNTFDCFIRVGDGALITVTYTNTDGGTYVVGASVSGWYWAVEDGRRWLETGR